MNKIITDIKALQKETKTGWKGMKTRWDVRVQWRKCAKENGAMEIAEYISSVENLGV